PTGETSAVPSQRRRSRLRNFTQGSLARLLRFPGLQQPRPVRGRRRTARDVRRSGRSGSVARSKAVPFHAGTEPEVGPPAEEFEHMMNLVRKFVRDESGEDLIEYGLLAAFVAAVALVTIIADPIGIKGSLVNAFNKARAALDAN